MLFLGIANRLCQKQFAVFDIEHFACVVAVEAAANNGAEVLCGAVEVHVLTYKSHVGGAVEITCFLVETLHLVEIAHGAFSKLPPL